MYVIYCAITRRNRVVDAELTDVFDVEVSSAMRIATRKFCLRRSILLVSVAFLAVASCPAVAAGAYTPPSGARHLAVGYCSACHGINGNSRNPMFPRLAGQKAWYLEQQLKEFRNHTRKDPYAVSYMWGMASGLSNATIDALAKYFSNQKAAPGTPHAPAKVAEGDKIYHHGIASQGVPPCAACHGADALGNRHFPRLAGQHAEYIMKQLNSFRTNMRDVAIMHAICTTLHPKQDKAVADYLASLSESQRNHGATMADNNVDSAAHKSNHRG